MKVFINKNKNKRVILLSIVVVFLFQYILTSAVNINFTEDVHAEALSPKDTLLLKVLKAGFKKCIDGGVLSKKEIKDSVINEQILFNVTSPIYMNDKNVRLPFKYGSGNTVDDGDISCEQLFTGYGGSGKNSFSTFSALGGKDRPNYNASVAERNSLIEALGYTTSDKGNTQLYYCAALNYTTTEAGGAGNARTTNSICVNVDGKIVDGKIVDGKITPSQGKKITSNDIVIKNTNSDEYIRLTVDPSYKKIVVNMNLSKLTNTKDPLSCQFGPTDIFTSENLDKYIGQSPESFFSKFFGDIDSKQILNKAKSNGYYLFNDQSCESDPFPKALGVSSVVTNSTSSISGGSGEEAVAGTELNNSPTKDYIYGGSPNYDNLMKYYLPSYSVPSAGAARGSLDYELYGGSSAATQTGGFTAVERAYNWFYELHDIFNAISVDTSIDCSTSRPSNGAYLQYFKKSESDPNKTEIQYCPMNESVLGLKANEALMKHETNGKGVVNAADPISDTIKPQTAREILNNLNSINLTSVCAADSSFPLCQATPIECKEDPNKDGCKDLAGNNASEEEDGANGEMAACFQNAGALGWMICPLIYTLRDAAQGIFSGFIEPLLRVHDSIIGELSKNDNTSTMYQAWSTFRNIGNILFVIALLFVIFSQVTGIGIDNYGIKRILPKLIVTAIIVNFSYIICGLLVDLSNIIGDSIKNIFESVEFTAGDKPSDGLGPVGIITFLVTAISAGAAAGAGITVAGSIIGAGGLLTILVPILTFLASAVIAGFFAMLMLGVRQALVIIMIVISPVAFVLYAIPNTNPIFKKWFTLFRGLLMLYPVYCFMVGAGYMASKLIINGSNEFYLQLVAGLISIAPYFAVPTMTKNAMKGFDAAIGGIARLQSRASGGLQYANKMATNSEAYKASAGNVAYKKQEKFANKYKDYTPEQLAQLSNGKRRRLMTALGVVGKDAQQAATIGAAMSQFKHDTDTAGMARTARIAMDREDDRQAESLQSEYARQNLDHISALAMLEEAQGFDYANASYEASRENDRKLRALQGHLLSTKEGQKAYNRYLSDGALYEKYETDASGKEIGQGKKIVSAEKSSTRAKATLARNFVSKHSDLKKDFGVTYTQMQSMQGSGDLESMKSSADASQIMSNDRTMAVNKYVQTMDSIDMQNLSKADAKELNTALATKDDNGNSIILDSDSSNKLKKLSDQVINVVSNDPSRLGDYNDNLRDLITNVSGTNLNNLGNRVMEVRDNNGQLIQTMRWAKNDPINGNGNGGGNGNGNGGGNGGNGNGNGSGNGGPTP